MKRLFSNNNNVSILSRSQQRFVMGGSGPVVPSSCSVTCADGSNKSKDCGHGVSCSTSGTSITCGTGTAEEMCPKKPD